MFEPKSSLGSVPRVETVEVNGEPPPSEGVVTPPPSELPAFQAVLWEVGAQGVDMRPHIYDKFSGQYMLLDSGAQISACPPDPGDVEDPSMTLRAANGSPIPCDGTVSITVEFENHPTTFTALVSPALGKKFLIGRKDLIFMGVLPENFPSRDFHGKTPHYVVPFFPTGSWPLTFSAILKYFYK